MSPHLRHLASLLAVGLMGAPAATRAQPPLSPDQAVRRAIDHDPGLRAAVADLERAELTVEGQAHRYRPTLTGELGLSQLATPNLGTRGVTVGSRDSLDLAVGVAQRFAWGTSVAGSLSLSREGLAYAQPGLDKALDLGPGYGLDLQLSVSQPLLRGLGRTLWEADLVTARVSRQAARSARDERASEVTRAVLVAYWDLWYAQAAVAIQARARDTAARRLREAEARSEAGAEAPLRILPLRSQVAALDEALATARAQVAQARAALARQIGAPLYGDAPLVAADEGPAPVELLPEFTAARDAALATAYGLGELRAAVGRARVQADVAADNARIRLDAEAWLKVSGLGNDAPEDALSMFGGFEAVSGGVTLKLELPTDRTAVEAAAASARLAVKGAQARLEAAREQLAQQVSEQLEAAKAARTRVSLAAETVRLAAATVDGQRDRFDSGAGTALELVMAQQDLREAELRRARARVDLERARLALAHLTGALLPDVAAGAATGDRAP